MSQNSSLPIRRLRVRYGDSLSFVLPVPQAYPERPERVRHLIRILEKRINSDLGLQGSAGVSIPSVVTADGYSVREDDRVAEVFEENERIVAMDMKTFVQQTYTLLERDYWLELTRPDLADGIKKWARVGAHKHGKVYIQLGTGGGSMKKLHLLQVKDLQTFLKGSQDALAIGNIEDEETGKWFAEARLKRLDAERAAVEVSVKVSSEKQTWSDQVELKVEGNRVLPGEVTHISGSEKGEDVLDVDYSDRIPEPERTGPSLVIKEKPVLKRHTSEGESQIDMLNGASDDKQLQKFVIVGSDAWSRDGQWNHYVTIPAITFTNRDSKTLSVVTTTMHYQDSEGEWRPCTGLRTGVSYPGRWGPEFQWFEDGRNAINLPAGVSENYSVRASITMTTGEPGTDNYSRARLHHSIDQPLLLRITIHDVDGKKRSLVVEAANDPLDVPTSEQKVKDWNAIMHAFVFVDNVEKQDRIWAAMYSDSGSEKEFHIRFSFGTYFTYDEEDMKRLQFKASENAIEEMAMEELDKVESTGNEWKITALFDKDNQYKPYALRFALKTTTSSVKEVAMLPKLKNNK